MTAPEATPPPSRTADTESFHAIAGQTASGVGWTAVALAVGFGTKVLLTRKMPAAELGVLLAAQAFVGLVLSVAELGVPDAVVRYVGMEAESETAPRGTVYTAIKIVSVSALLTAGLVLAGLWTWFTDTMTADAFWATVVLAAGLPLLALGDVVGAAYRGVNRLGTKLFAVDVARPGVVAIALVLSPAVLTRHATYVAGLYVCGASVTLAVFWVFFSKDRRWRSRGGCTWPALMAFGLPIAGAAILAGPLVNGVLPIMLSAWTGTTAVAFFGIALSLQAIVNLPIGIFEMAAVPTWARMVTHAPPDDLAHSYRQYANICFAAATGLGIILIVNDEAILTTVFGPAYAAASWALRVAIIATLLGALSGPNGAMLRAVGQPGTVFVARLVGAVTSIAVGALAIPTYGLSGAMMAYAAAVVVVNVVQAAALYQKTAMHPITGRHASTAALAVAGIFAATAMVNTYPVGAWVGAHAIAVLAVAVDADLRLAVRTVARSLLSGQ